MNNRVKVSFVMLTIMALLLTPWSHITTEFSADKETMDSSARSADPWTENQPWGQFGGGPDRRHTPPSHSADGGAGNGTPSEATTLGSILDPVINWEFSIHNIIHWR